MSRQREIQRVRYEKYIGTRCEVMVEGKNEVRANTSAALLTTKP